MIYKGEYLNEISFPLGGIGTGSVGLAGNGSLVDFEIFNRPNKNSVNPFSFFAISAEYPDGKRVCKVLAGDVTKDLSGRHTEKAFTGFGFGPYDVTMCGFPHFKTVRFDGSFPIAKVTFSDENFPAKVVMEAFNPFIPQDAKNSSLPTAIFNLKVKSLCDGVKYTLILSFANPFCTGKNEEKLTDRLCLLKLSSHGIEEADKDYGDITIATDCENPFTIPYWYRGRWKDNAATFWREMEDGDFTHRVYSDAGEGDVGSVGGSIYLNKGQSKSVRFLIAWNIPNCYKYWGEENLGATWKNYYATLFENSAATAEYVLKNYPYLHKKTESFKKSLHGSTLDPTVIDAVSSTLSVLKSPTVLRLTDGTFYGWEGVHEKAGSCEGTCTHVWSYAYALAFLFPELERSIRETEFKYDTDKDGKMSFRTQLPIGVEKSNFRACLDGQMASVIKTYREWKISGNDAWLKENWQTVKSLIEYAWSENNPDRWDLDCDGILEGRQHHTLDMEMFGPSSWLEGLYALALRAGALMAEAMGDTTAKEKYSALYGKAKEYIKEELFSGEYFIQKVDLTDKSCTEEFDCPDYWNEEKGELKYQIAEGCEIDQMLADWHAKICGLDGVFDKEQKRVALKNMYENLYKPSMREFPNAWRVFAINDEAGAVMCDYPEGVRRPVIPIPYSDECMTGFEYAFAGLLISEGFCDEGLNIVRSVRARYDGKKRNPYNEIECGSNYARAMSSFALLPILSGFEYDLTKGYIGFAPINAGDFKCLWSAGLGWGDYSRELDRVTVSLNGGEISLSSIKTGLAGGIKKLLADGKKIGFTEKDGILFFDKVKIKKRIEAYL